RFHGDPPDVANHENTAQMFLGFYHTRRVPCTQKPSSRATLTLNSFRVPSIGLISVNHYRCSETAVVYPRQNTPREESLKYTESPRPIGAARNWLLRTPRPIGAARNW